MSGSRGRASPHAHWFARGKRKMLDWTAIRTVLIDMDGTILDLNFDNLF